MHLSPKSSLARQFVGWACDENSKFWVLCPIVDSLNLASGRTYLKLTAAICDYLYGTAFNFSTNILWIFKLQSTLVSSMFRYFLELILLVFYCHRRISGIRLLRRVMVCPNCKGGLLALVWTTRSSTKGFTAKAKRNLQWQLEECTSQKQKSLATR